MYVYMYVSPTNIHTSILGAAVGMYVCCLDNQLTSIHTSWVGGGAAYYSVHRYIHTCPGPEAEGMYVC